jgi:hypothetical protein
MQNEEIPRNQPNDLNTRQLAARMHGLELRVVALEQAELRRQEAGAELLRKMVIAEPGANLTPALEELEKAAARTAKALARLERKNKSHKG